jgi:hypothetical protein
MELYGNQKRALAGLKFGLSVETESVVAGEDFYPGDPVFGMVGDNKEGYKACPSSVTLTASAELVEENSIIVTINGITLASVVFKNTSKETIQTLVDAINQSEEIRVMGIDAFVLEPSPLAIQLQATGAVTITASAVVTGGASQATFSSAANNTTAFMGVVRFEQIVHGREVGYFPQSVALPVQTWGKIWVPVAESADPDDKMTAYVIMTGTDAGKFTQASQSTETLYNTGGFFRSSKDSDGLALLELRGMKTDGLVTP